MIRHTLAVVAALTLTTCSDQVVPSSPSSGPSPTPSPAASSGSSSGGAAGVAGHKWTEHGVTVTVLEDEWGPGTCHQVDSRACRTFLVENNSPATVYSRGVVFDGPEQGCGAYGPGAGGGKKGPTEGPDHVDAGQAAELKYCWEPHGKTCRAQWDDSLGPEGVSIVHDVFDAQNDLCQRCVEDPVETVVEDCGDWTVSDCVRSRECVRTTSIDFKCKADTTSTERYTDTERGAWSGAFFATYLSTSGSGYYTTDDGSRWLEGLTLNRGNQNTLLGNHAVDGSRLCLKWRHETIGCDRATCADVEPQWHGRTEFRCECLFQ